MLNKIISGILIGFIAAIVITLVTCLEAKSQQTYVGPTRGSISSLFGWRKDPFNGTNRFHAGLDIAAKSGTPIYSLQEGYVVYVGPKGGYGDVVILKHQYADIPEIPVVETMYAHTSKALVTIGQSVRRGDPIALVGSTGRSTGPHLHFEVHYNGGYVNPVDYLTKLPKYLAYVAFKRSRYFAYKKPVNPPVIKPHITAQQKANYIMIED